MENINERISMILQDSKMTKTAFAESLKVSQQYISKLIRTGNPSELLIDDICEKYGVSREWLLHGIKPMYKVVDDKLSMYVSEITDGDDDFIKDLIETYMELDESSKNALKVLAKGMAEKYIKREQSK